MRLASIQTFGCSARKRVTLDVDTPSFSATAGMFPSLAEISSSTRATTCQNAGFFSFTLSRLR